MSESFVLKDANGEEHAYEVILHGARAGRPIHFALMRMSARPLLEALEQVAKSGELMDALFSDKGDAAAALMGDPQAMIEKLNLGGLGSKISTALASEDLENLSDLIFAHTRRDKTALSDGVVFDLAYQANYGEMLLALIKVIRLNRFLPLPGIS